MRKKSWNRQIRRAVRIVLVVIVVAAPLGFVTLWLALQHKPSWYAPAVVTDALVKRAQRDTAALSESITQHLVKGRPIEVRLTQDRINEWLAALPRLSPEGWHGLPEQIKTMAVSMEPGRIRIGVHYVDDSWQAILNAGLSLGLSQDVREVTMALSDVQGGALTAPRALLDRMLASRPAARSREDGNARGVSLGSLLERVRSADDLFSGIRVPNRFVWPNGERAFRIDELRLEDGEVRLRLQPI